MVERTLGAPAAGTFHLSIDNGTGCSACFTVESTGGTVAVSGSTASELSYGVGWYLKRYVNMSFAWQRAGGFQVRLPAGEPSAQGRIAWPEMTKTTVTKAKPWTYYENVCTESYSMWWWSWARWERELDWMAMHGVNIALAYVGQEQIFREVYNALGVNDSVIKGTFDGPAFQAWSRGQGSAGVGGPIPDTFLLGQVALNQNITRRMRQLGISPILPAFQGNVPAAFIDIFPGHNITRSGGGVGHHGAWLNSDDPLFLTIAASVRDGMARAFGASQHFEADGWFGSQTGPWYEGDRRQMQMQTSASRPMPGTAADWNGTEGTKYKAGLGDTVCPAFTIPSRATAAQRASTVFSTYSQQWDGASTFVYQGYPWARLSGTVPGDPPNPCNKTALGEFIAGFVGAIPKDAQGRPRLLVLDLIADEPSKDWVLWDNEGGALLHGAPSIWCALENWGGAVHIGGDLTHALAQSRAALRAEAVVGVGLTPEGIDNNPAYFEAVTEAPWLEETQTAGGFLADWGVRRCGRELPEVREAYGLLFRTVYRPGQPYLFCCSQPYYCSTVLPGGGTPNTEGSVARPAYNTTMLRMAWALMASAAPNCSSAAFDYDVAAVGREYLSVVPCLTAFDKVNASGSAAALKADTAALLDVSSDIDALLKTSGGHLLGSWLQGARDLATKEGNAALADFYEWNSRSQITTWTPMPAAGGRLPSYGLNDYARKQWSGMISQYYNGRVRLWLEHALKAKTKAAAATDGDGDGSTPIAGAGAAAAWRGGSELEAALVQFAFEFQNKRLDPSSLPTAPVGDAAVVSKALLRKYAGGYR
jgi:alpha-N-acetylglucosaminidase